MDWRFAKLACDLAQVLGARGANGTQLEPKDFLLSFEARKEVAPVKSPEQQKADRIKFLERIVKTWCNGANAIYRESKVKRLGGRT
jgi:hypothetical protein